MWAALESSGVQSGQLCLHATILGLSERIKGSSPDCKTTQIFFFPLFFVSFCFYNKPRIQPIIAAEGSLSREEGRKIPCWQVSCVCRGCCGEPDGCRGPPRLQLCLTMLPVAVHRQYTGLFQSSPHQVSLALPLPSRVLSHLPAALPTGLKPDNRGRIHLSTQPKNCFHSLPPSLLPFHVHAHPDTRENRLLEKDWLWLKTQPRKIID